MPGCRVLGKNKLILSLVDGYNDALFTHDSWLMSVYARDILSRLPQLLATCTAVFGTILKIDSTKKVCKKLQGTAAGSASWCTNVGNERGEVLMSVLTESEGLEGLRPMALGLIDRYVFCACMFSCIAILIATAQISQG